MNSFSIQSFGCRVNQAEAFRWSDVFQKQGLTHTKDVNQSDLVVVNTCTLTHRADRDVRSFIRKVSRENPQAKILVTGCYAQRKKETLKRNPRVWEVLSNQEKENLAEKVLFEAHSYPSGSFYPYRSRALVKIQDGCDFRCTFCIIPSVRGKSVSGGKERILSQIKEYVRQGFREVVLTGVHICLYGLDSEPQSSLMELLEEIEAVDGLGWIRLSSLDPRFLNPSLLDHITSSQIICPHFHLSLQNGSDQILKWMGRNIKVSRYQEVLHRLFQSSPRASLGADIMVGFPGETEDDFEKTRLFLQQSPLSYFHVFPYSPRPWTKASSWDYVEDKLKTERARKLRALSRKKRDHFYKKFLGETLPAVVIKKGKGGAQLLTPNYLRVNVPWCPAEEKEEVKVKINRTENGRVQGQVVD
ncbi:tRNA (N(6)-L-threonylcarbamoyladenosine(37)-C(2))-methylthiotransferase MtaB [bacterium]|nr:tRNA (N(6)-L-threonylcarbamoyladenosine(37)-C(2))-methylthiotransferase MtaB [bacterium]